MIVIVDHHRARGTALAEGLRREGLSAEVHDRLPSEPFSVAIVLVDGPGDLVTVAEGHLRGRVLALVPDGLRVSAFEQGADDVTAAAPLSFREVALRARGLGRSPHVGPPAPAPSPPPLPPDILRPADRGLRTAAGWVLLSEVEFALVAALAERPGRAWSREELLDRVWGPGVGARTVDSTVKRLRARLGPAGEAIETVRGRGYRWAPSRLEA